MKYKTSIVDGGIRRCYLCGSPYQIEVHHIFSNANRKKSTEYGLVVCLCRTCHQKAHKDYQVMKKLRVIGQQAFQREYPDLDFLKIFGRNYL